MTTDDVKGIAELALVIKRKAEEEALIQALGKLADLVCEEDGAAVVIEIAGGKFRAAISHRGSLIPYDTAGCYWQEGDSLHDALQNAKRASVRLIRHRIHEARTAYRRSHSRIGWADWVEKRLAEIEAEHERAVS